MTTATAPRHRRQSTRRDHLAHAACYLAVAFAAALCSGVAVALTWGKPQLPLAAMSIIYALIAALMSTERAAVHLACARD